MPASVRQHIFLNEDEYFCAPEEYRWVITWYELNFPKILILQEQVEKGLLSLEKKRDITAPQYALAIQRLLLSPRVVLGASASETPRVPINQVKSWALPHPGESEGLGLEPENMHLGQIL